MGTEALPLQQKRAWIHHISLKAVTHLQHFEAKKKKKRWATVPAAVCCLPTCIFFTASSLSCFQTSLSVSLSLSLHLCRGRCLKKLPVDPSSLRACFIMSFKTGIAAACLWGESLRWPIGSHGFFSFIQNVYVSVSCMSCVELWICWE